jgi:hypothetical protein
MSFLSKACVGWLLLLIVLPFSAPFSTCDLSTFLSGTSEQQAQPPIVPHGPVSLDSSASPHVLPHARVSNRQQRMAPVVDAIDRVIITSGFRVRSEVAPVARLASPIVSPLRI